MGAITRWLVVFMLPLSIFYGHSRPSDTAAEQWVTNLRAVVDAERSFAAAAAEKGIRDAFLAFLADDAVLFRPQPVPGKKWLMEHPPAVGLLSWRPIFADVAAAGDLGYTTGPYEFRKQAADAKPASYGNYFTIWKKQQDGSWKALVDFGIVNPAPVETPPDFDPSRAKAPGTPPSMLIAGGSQNLIDLDDKLEHSTAATAAAALGPYVSEDARFLHGGRQPAVGRKAVNALLTSEPGTRSCKPMKSGSANSGDLGYTYGSFSLLSAGAASKTGYYLRVWKRQSADSWKIVVEVVNY